MENAARPALERQEWTRELPNAEGWYWMRFDGEYYGKLYPGTLTAEVLEPKMLSVYRKGNAWYFTDLILGETRKGLEQHAYWVGPLEPPAFNVPAQDVGITTVG